MLAEGVFDDKLENNLVQCFSLLHKTQYILGLSRVTIKDRVVKVPNYRQNLYSLSLVLCAIISEFFYQMFYYHAFYYKNKLMYYACSLGTISQFLTYITWMFVARFTNAETNLMIYYRLQNIDRILKLTRDTYFTEFQAALHNITLILTCVCFPLGFALHAWSLVDNPAFTSIVGVALLSIYVDFLFFGGFIYYIALRTTIFNKMLKNHIKLVYGNEQPEQESSGIVQMVVSLIHPNIDQIDGTLEWTRWSECIQEILTSYQMVNELFNFPIMNLTLTVVIWTFIGIAAMLVGYRSGLYPLVATVTLAVWDIYYGVLLIVAALLSYWISSLIKETKMLCIRVMYYNYDDPYRKAASKLLRIIHYKKPKFVVYGVFELDTTLPLTVIGIIASNILVVIQFIVTRD